MATLAQRRAAARARLHHGARRVGGFLAPRVMALGTGAGIGAGAMLLAQMAAGKIAFVKNHWYGEPIALGVGAFLMAKRRPTWAHALAGAAGYSAAFRYKLNQFQAGKGETPVPTFVQGASTGLLQQGGQNMYQGTGAYADVAF